MERERILQQMDACRPDRNDLDQAELAELAARLKTDVELQRAFETAQRLDRRIGAALREGDVPEGLADRLLEAALAATGESQDVPPDAEGSVPIPSPPLDTSREVSLPQPRKLSRRRALLACTGVAATAVAILLMVRLTWLPGEVGPERLSEDVAHWCRQVMQADQAWRDPETAPLDEYSPDRAIIGTLAGWKNFDAGFDRTAVVYRIEQPRGRYALLFVVRSSRSFAVQELPYSLLDVSEGWSAGAWEHQDHLYVLAVPGPHLDAFIRMRALT